MKFQEQGQGYNLKETDNATIFKNKMLATFEIGPYVCWITIFISQ